MLRGLFREVPLEGATTFMPIVRVGVVRGQNSSVEVDGLLDSGSACNLIPISAVRSLLGMTQDEARRGRRMSICGLGGSTSFAYGWQVDLRLRATTSASDCVLWRGVWLYVCDTPLPPIAQVLIGQSSGLEERVFVHLNQNRGRYWLIRS